MGPRERGTRRSRGPGDSPKAPRPISPAQWRKICPPSLPIAQTATLVKPSLQLRLGQQLTLTPQLQQAIRLLTLSTLELRHEMQQALESNPLLEPEEFRDAEGADGAAGEQGSDPDLPEWDDTYTTRPAAQGAAPADLADRQPEGDTRATEGLSEHLLWQLRLTPMSERDRAIAEAVVDGLDDSGYLADSLEDLREALLPELHVDPDEIEAVVHRLQRFDPVGVAARNLRECLLVQLSELNGETPSLDTARALVEHHLENLARGETEKIRRRLDIDEAVFSEAVALIRNLEPRPGAAVARPGAEYVVPDVYVSRRNGDWAVSLNPQALPRLCINQYYSKLIGKTDGESATYLRGQLQEARWFLKSIRTRNDTLLGVARAIVKAQEAFLEHGEEAMKPMVLRDIAEAVDMHESTISRVTTRKYMYTPRGVFEFKYFFSSHVGTADGGECSATAIQAMLRRLVDDEPPGKPLSDSRLAKILQERGIDVARRTVAKYREAMRIPSSTERRRMARASFAADRHRSA